MSKISIEAMSMSTNDITIEAEHAGNIAYYRSLSKFESLEAFNAHYRSLTYTYAELLDQKPSFKAILKALFDSAPSTFGVPFMRRETLAEKAGVSLRSVGNFLKVATDTFGISTLKQLGKKDKRYGGYAYLVYVFSPLPNLRQHPSNKVAEEPSENEDCTASCTASLHSVEMPKALEPQAIEDDTSAPNQDSFKQASPSEIKDIKYKVQDTVGKQITTIEYISPFDKDIDMLLTGYGILEKIQIQKTIEKSLKKRNLLFANAKMSVLKALETLVYFQRQANRGLFAFKKGIHAFLTYNLNLAIDEDDEIKANEEYDQAMRDLYSTYNEEDNEDFFNWGIRTTVAGSCKVDCKGSNRDEDFFANSYASMSIKV
ncbi:hypothetical protein [Peribacillus frigoritolerans]|uniref:Helix-turn-helix domain-containing protein n=1 Tax=Peribacillus frigoritolerans TaxID=450367 RepID=A0AAJ1QQW4_9BACI|nr:hypothetical protein [Peribacillus frigoritolerans]MDM5285666.1 hypothetical protein [Peribacillus frigoritolerans]